MTKSDLHAWERTSKRSGEIGRIGGEIARLNREMAELHAQAAEKAARVADLALQLTRLCEHQSLEVIEALQRAVGPQEGV